MAMLATIWGCQPGDRQTVPEDILGVWKTAHPKYEDRYIEITKDALIFGTGGDTFRLHAIADVDNSREGKSIMYTITHINHEGQRYRFSFYYDPEDNGTMRLKHQQRIIWKRERKT